MKHHDWMSLQSPFSALQDLERLLVKLFGTQWNDLMLYPRARNDCKDSVSLQLHAEHQQCWEPFDDAVDGMLR